MAVFTRFLIQIRNKTSLLRSRRAYLVLLRCVPLAWCITCGASGLLLPKNAGDLYLFRALNLSRAQAGLQPLVWSEELTRTAEQHLEMMYKDGTVAHQLAGEADLLDRVAAAGMRFTLVSENIGVAPSMEALHTMWIHSPEHQDNMLDPSATSVGIALLKVENELWAVEDFAHAIPELSLSQQEARVSHLLQSAGLSAAASGTVREMCSLESGYVGRRPAFVMRFQSAELTRLPPALLQRLQRGKVTAEVGACAQPGKKFAPFRLAVALYPQSGAQRVVSRPAASSSSAVAGCVISICSRSLARLK